MMISLKEKLTSYVEKFNGNDEEIIRQAIPNEKALEWMEGNIPLLELPDPILEEIYYFRWWVYRKHIKKTEKGYVITEFLPDVPWAGPYNTINCSSGFHIREGRWLACGATYLEDYIRFWLNQEGNTRSYSCWLAYAIWEYCTVKGDFSIALNNLEKICRNYREWEALQKMPVGLFWSNDDRDCMEFSISGPGLRPTLNSYMYADAWAIAHFAAMAGDRKLEKCYRKKAEELKHCIQKYLWDQDFFKVIPSEDMEKIAEGQEGYPQVSRAHNVRELIGYIPWYFNLPDAGYEKAFIQLKKEDGFLGKYGLMTAERRHQRFCYAADHECLWNGPVWPYATTQTLVALANLLRNYHQNYVDKEDYYHLLRQYAQSQHLRRADGTLLPWIDEDMDPDTGEWTARRILSENGWKKEKGGYERGKDYNHSMFCDLIFSGLLGIDSDGTSLELHPIIPDDWEYFRVEKLWFQGQCYDILFDRQGNHYGVGKGLHIHRLT